MSARKLLNIMTTGSALPCQARCPVRPGSAPPRRGCSMACPVASKGDAMARPFLRMRRDAARICAFAVTVAVGVLAAPPAGAQRSVFRVEEATIADVHRAMLARQLTASQLVNEYLKRIAAYNGTCVKGTIDPATGFQLGDIEPVENAGQLNALITINQRGKRSKTDSADSDPAMPDALEVARQLDAEFARTGRLKGPLHGIPFAIKDQFDTFDMRTTSGAAANYANDRPPRDAEVVARLRQAGAIILAKANMGEYASGD